MSDPEKDRLPRRCGDGEPDGHGCGLFFAAKDRAAYAEHRPICQKWRLPKNPPRVSYGYGYALVRPQEAL